jgi:hypothetical protein
MQLTIWKRATFYALALWAIVFAVILLLVLLGLSNRPIPTDVVLMIVAVLVYWSFATRLHLVSMSQGFFVGAGWIFINVLLDYFIIVRGFNGGNMGFFYAWVIWARYALLLFIPIITSSRRQVTQ